MGRSGFDPTPDAQQRTSIGYEIPRVAESYCHGVTGAFVNDTLFPVYIDPPVLVTENDHRDDCAST
jgi:hypothetical protein